MKKLLILIIGILIGLFILYDNLMAQPNVKDNNNSHYIDNYSNGKGNKPDKPDFPPDGKGWTKFCDCETGNHTKHFKKCQEYCNYINGSDHNVPIDGGIFWLMLTSIAYGIYQLKKKGIKL